MTFNWITNGATDEAMERYCIELEYQLRPRITRFLLDRLGPDFLEDLTDFHFDVDLAHGKVRFAPATPERYARRFRGAFDAEIGDNF